MKTKFSGNQLRGRTFCGSHQGRGRGSIWNQSKVAMALQLVALLAMLAVTSVVHAAEFFGPISVSHQPLVVGETSHGYREYRFLLENSSLKETHKVELVFPDRSYDTGNSISRMTRAVTLAPGARVAVPIWQPPLMQSGNSMLRVIVDGEMLGTLTVPVANHMGGHSSHYGGGLISASVLVSRSVNFDDLSKALRGQNRMPHAAMMAVGAPDAGRSRGVVAGAWCPDHSSSGPHWIELEFNPVQADRLRLHETMGPIYSGTIHLTGVSGTNFPPVPITHVGGPVRPGANREFAFPLSSEPIKKVRFEFGSVYAGVIGIDAVQLVGPSGAGWAIHANASSEYPSHSAPSGIEPNRLLRSEIPVSEWSDAWLSFTPFDGIAISGRDWQTMPPAIQTAVSRYVECGGILILLGSPSVPEQWQTAPRESIKNGESISAGFGKCLVFRSDRLPEDGSDPAKLVQDTLSSAALPWQNVMDEGTANASFPVVANVKIPVRGIVVIMLGFVVLIGPVNIIYLTRKNRRIWLLWTIPAISLVTTLTVFAYSILREGFTPDMRVEGVTFLDQANHRAASLGMAAYYCPLTPGGGLFFSSDTEATPLVSQMIGRHQGGSSREVDWTRGQHLERGWVTARVPAHFQLRKAETRRERIQLEGDSVVNGLGAPIKELWLADATGKVSRARNVAPGAKAKLESTTEIVSGGDALKTLTDRVAFRQIGDFETVGGLTAPQYLRRGSYIALLEGNPFLESGMQPKSGRLSSTALVYGILESNSRP